MEKSVENFLYLGKVHKVDGVILPAVLTFSSLKTDTDAQMTPSGSF